MATHLSVAQLMIHNKPFRIYVDNLVDKPLGDQGGHEFMGRHQD
ncbi:hypothetical protein [Endozoicomonas sp. YOMI1]|nr:hypothetical protein [Endozoicomonas sp. YOMI1]